MSASEQPRFNQPAECRRALGRAVVGVRSRLATSAEAIEVEIADLSLCGARIEAARALSVAQCVWLDLGRRKVFGEIKWTRGTTFGVEFEEKLPKALVLSLCGGVVDAQELAEVETVGAARDWVVGTGVERSKSVRLYEVLGGRGLPGDRPVASRASPQRQAWPGRFFRQQQGESVPKFLPRVILAAVVLGGLAGVLSVLCF